MEHSVPEHFTSLEPFIQLFRDGAPIVTYHAIATKPRGLKMRGNFLSPKLLGKQLAEFADAGFQSGSLSERSSPGQVVLTFDDGYRSVYENALPLLNASHCKGIVFLVSGEIGGVNRWDIVKGELEFPLMDDQQIREWLSAGHEIGAHTVTHRALDKIPLAEARTEIFESKKTLEDRFGVAVRHFCYPYGDYNADVLRLVQEAGYETAVTTKFGVNDSSVPPLELKRVPARHKSFKLRDLLGLKKRR